MPNRWNGERISLGVDTPVELVQTHLSRYVWSMGFCDGKDVLDVGCGTGYGTWLISTRAKTVIGVDQCAEAIAEAQSNFSGTFICSMMEDVEFDNACDVVTCFEVLEHLKNLDAGMANIVKFLKPDGVALISLPLHLPLVFHHYRDFGYQQWKALLLQHFEIHDVYYQAMEDVTPNNVCIQRVGLPEDWSEASLRQEPEHGVVLFVCRGKK